MVERYFFSLINNTIMTSKNESILHHTRMSCHVFFIEKKHINLIMIIANETAIRDKQG